MAHPQRKRRISDYELEEFLGSTPGTPLGSNGQPAGQGKTPKPFQQLTRQESIAILDDTIEWLIDEARATFVMPDGPSKERRRAELRARDKSIARDFRRLIREQEG